MASDFYIALFFGGFTIWVFSRDQFERPSYQPSKELKRIAEFLQPSDLRNRRIALSARAFYTAMLLLIYVACSFFMIGPIGQAFGFQSNLVNEVMLAPIAVSFAMVGLAPAVRPLQKFEELLRVASHRVSGIPARLIAGAQILNARKLDFGEAQQGCLISDRDWERMRHYSDCAHGILDDPDDFDRDITKIFAFRAWVIRQNLFSHKSPPPARISRNEVSLGDSIERLVHSLDSLSAFMPQDENDPATPSRDRTEWERYAKDADELASDLCALLMLYVEHGVLGVRTDLETEAEEALTVQAAFFHNIEFSEADHRITNSVWVRATITAVVSAFVVSIAYSAFDPSAGSGMLRTVTNAVQTALSALLIYVPSILFALLLHDQRVKSNTWPSLYREDWTNWMVPVMWIGLACAAFAAIGLVAFNLYAMAIEHGLAAVVAKFWQAAFFALLVEGPRGFLASILVIGLIALFDGWRAGAGSSWRYGVTILVGVSMFATSAIAQGWAIQVSREIHCAGDAACIEALPTIWALLFTDPLLALAGLRSCIVGVMVMIVSARTLHVGMDAFNRTAGQEIPAPVK
ncbi:hypothetical protein [Pseudoruegeria sp. HB172150]|uniref:hypothetical protein n=1 Tax=Pseudoruegeria sp. HB172150 TaxID=2721164 RepID=UPI00155779CF|nr:hypothetical protein [Pseudoruegeria sp. HB172150]